MNTTHHQNKPIVIIGSGLAAYTLIREYRKLNAEQAITVITQESGDFYSKPMLSTAFASKKDAQQLISSSAAKMMEQLNIQIHSHSKVLKIDGSDQSLSFQSADGKEHVLQYSKLVLALGADQIQIDLAGDGADQVMTVNDLQDYAVFRERIGQKKKLVILGAGLIGCEFANDLSLGGYHVEVVDLADQVLGRLLPRAIADELQAKLSALGVLWHLGTSAKTVSRAGDGFEVGLSNGNVLQADCVLSAIGLRPRTELAKRAGIKTDRGIVVNRQLETSIQGIYSLGDCAEVEGHVLPYVMPIMQAARTLASILAGHDSALIYPAMPVMIKTPALPLVVSPPASGSEGSWTIKQEENGIEGLFYSPQAQLLGFALAGSATAQRATLTKLLPNILGE
jgi:rubredoxin---NAD+ reductase